MSKHEFPRQVGRVCHKFKDAGHSDWSYRKDLVYGAQLAAAQNGQRTLKVMTMTKDCCAIRHMESDSLVYMPFPFPLMKSLTDTIRTPWSLSIGGSGLKLTF